MSYFKRIILFLLFSVGTFEFTANAQCVIDSSQTRPGLHPDSLINGTVNQFYSQDITFVMVTDTLGLTINNFQIASLNGLPLGMQWTCNNSANGCNYNPAVSIFGCVRIYGTPVLAGTYPLSVTVVASVVLIGNQTFNFNTSIVIDPATISNAGFSMNNALGCAPLTVGFTNNIPSPQYTNWNFGNGDSSLLENPPAVTYSQPGDYVVKQITIADTTEKFYLTEVKIDSIPNNAGFLDTPDMYILVKNQAGFTVYDSRPALTNVNPPVSFTIPSLQLMNQTYSIFLWDEDTGLTAPDDPLGTISFIGNGLSDTAYATVSGASGRLKLIYTIVKLLPIQNVAVDTVHVYPTAIAPIVTANGPLTFCDGDTVILNSNFIGSNQWYNNGNLMVGETNSSLVVSSSGNYYDVVSNNYGCNDTTALVAVNVNFLPPYPNFAITGNLLTANVSGVFTYQWILNDTLLSGATSASYTAIISGDYRLQITDTNGCSRKSFPINVLVTGIQNDSKSSGIYLFPNPAKTDLTLSFDRNWSTDLTIKITTSIGSLIYERFLNHFPDESKLIIPVSAWKKGIYFVQVHSTKYSFIEKLIIE